MVVIIDLIHIDLYAARFFDQLARIVDDRQGTQPQKVHFQQTELLDRRHCKLRRDDSVGTSRQRHIFLHRQPADHDTCRMYRRMAGQPLKPARHVDEPVHCLVVLIGRAQLGIYQQRLIDRDAQLHRNAL